MEKSQNLRLDLGEEGMRVQLDGVTDGWWEYRLNASTGRHFWGNGSLGFVGSWQEAAPA